MWVIWWVALAVCPVTIFLIGEVCEGKYSFEGQPKQLINILGLLPLTHLGLSLACAIVACDLLNEWVRRYVAWLAILVMLVVTVCVWVNAEVKVGSPGL
jgi:hypothetical protein